MGFPKDFTPEQGGGENRYTMTGLKSGEAVKFRFMSDLIAGNSVWGEDEKGNRVCTRVKTGENIPTSAIGVNKFTGEPERVKQFVAGVVYNYNTEKIEIFETDKSTVIEPLFEYELNDDYGDLKNYDITIKKTGEKMETKYSVIASPPKKIDEGIVQFYKDTQVDLSALYRGDDPFKVEIPEELK